MSYADTAPDAPHDPDEVVPEATTPEGDPGAAGSDTDASADVEDGQTFPAHVVRSLREANGRYRTRANQAEARADELSRALFTARVAATGKVENAAEIPFDADILDDLAAIDSAIDSAISARPYIKARRVDGTVGQGIRGAQTATPTWGSLLTT